ncbi:MAG: hypothetical protein JWQ90_325 [Hydrocarboniphaga sp.]|nr:hypothetical protein [Hydrocarboniphaga sp.]
MVILPISGERLKFTTVGTRFMGIDCAFSTASSVVAAVCITSKVLLGS